MAEAQQKPKKRRKRRKRQRRVRLLAVGLIVAAIGVLLGVLLFGSCRGKPEEEGGLLAAAIFVTGNLEGRLVPCGCEEGERGGVARIAMLFRQWAEERSDHIIVDIGNATISTAHPTHEAVNGFVFEALDRLGCTVVNCGVNEINLPRGRLEALARSRSFTVVCANFVDAESRRPVVAPYHVVQRGGLRIAFIGLVQEADPQPLAKQGYACTKAEEALGKCLETLEGQAELIVVLAYLPPEQLYALAKAFPQVDLVLGGATTVNSARAERFRNTSIAYLGDEGTSVGRVDFNALPGQTPQADFQTTVLADRISDDADMAKLVGRFRSALGADGLPGAAWDEEMPCTSEYVGSDVCRVCHVHTKQYYKWLKTPHAGAYVTLLKQSKHGDRTCLPCHTTGYLQPGGYDPDRPDTRPKKVAGLKPDHIMDKKHKSRAPLTQNPMKSVGCESCHGGARRHLGQALKHRKNPSEVRFEPHLRARAALRNCQTTCHIKDRPCLEEEEDPFDLGEYLEKIKHWDDE